MSQCAGRTLLRATRDGLRHDTARISREIVYANVCVWDLLFCADSEHARAASPASIRRLALLPARRLVGAVVTVAA
jgi:hypothetical protein